MSGQRVVYLPCHVPLLFLDGAGNMTRGEADNQIQFAAYMRHLFRFADGRALYSLFATVIPLGVIFRLPQMQELLDHIRGGVVTHQDNAILRSRPYDKLTRLDEQKSFDDAPRLFICRP